MVLGLTFEVELFKFGLVQGIALGALYGILAVALVLTFRMSRVVGFVHGGIATAAAFVYWYLIANPALTSGAGIDAAFDTRQWPKGVGVAAAVLLGALLGVLFGSQVTGRMATWPRVTVTTFSLGAMLLIAGVVASVWEGAFELVESPFGQGNHEVLGYVVSRHQLFSIGLLVALVAVLHVVLTRTKLGTQIRAIADDIEAAEMVGIRVRRIAIGVWCVAGALAGLGGVLVTPMTRLASTVVLFVLLRSTAGAVLGGFDSLPLALGGAFVFGQVESQVQAGTFGTISSGWREVILMIVLFAGVLILARRNLTRFKLAEA